MIKRLYMHSFENQLWSLESEISLMWKFEMATIKWYMTLTNGEPCWQQLFCYDLMTKKEKKSCTVVKDIRCILKLDLWPPQGWPCGCQHDPIAQNSLHVLSRTSKKQKKNDCLIDKKLDAYGRKKQTKYCEIVQ